jgi:hypothetical protein
VCDQARRKPSTKQAAPWQRKRPRPPLPGIREPGPYARDQVREETRTHGQHGKKRAGWLWRRQELQAEAEDHAKFVVTGTAPAYLLSA